MGGSIGERQSKQPCMADGSGSSSWFFQPPHKVGHVGSPWSLSPPVPNGDNNKEEDTVQGKAGSPDNELSPSQLNQDAMLVDGGGAGRRRRSYTLPGEVNPLKAQGRARTGKQSKIDWK